MPKTDPIKPNAKALLDKALPANTGGHVLALREYHTQTGHLQYLADHLQELATKHHVGTIGLERAPTLMLFEWAYRDAKTPTEKATAKQLLRDAYYSMGKHHENVDVSVRLITEAIDRGVAVVGFDARHLFSEAYPYYAAAITQAGVALDQPLSKLPADYQAMWLFHQAKKLYDAHPEYKAKLDVIEGTVKQLRAKGVPTDVISATLATQMADPHKNMITVSGSVHLQGSKFGGEEDAQGIFDEGMTAAHWKVTDGFVGTKQEMVTFTAVFTSGTYNMQCATHDQADFALLCDTDELATRTHALKVKESKAVQEQLTHIDPCAGSPAVEKVYKPEQLNPSLIPGMKEAIAKLHQAFGAPAHSTSLPTSSAPKAASDKRR